MYRIFTFSASYKPHKNPVYDYIQYHCRSRRNPASIMIPRHDLRSMIKAMKRGNLMWYAPDQDYGRRVSRFIPWFGIPSATLAATPRLLIAAQVPALGVIHRRLPNYRGYEITLMPPIAGIPSKDGDADLARINQHIEDCVRSVPAEYLWVHRRFKTRPKGMVFHLLQDKNESNWRMTHFLLI